MLSIRTLARVLNACFVAFTVTWACPTKSQPAPSTPVPGLPAGRVDPCPLSDPGSACWDAKAPETARVRVDTSKGSFEIEVVRDWAPIGADRFVNLVRAGYYDDSRFFRVRAGFVAQFGIAGDARISGLWRQETIVDDPGGVSNVRGTVAYAMTGSGTRSTQVFINLADNHRLDAQGFAPIGRVVVGMDVVERLYASYDEGAGGGMRGGKQDAIFAGGNGHLDLQFPALDRLLRARLVRGES